MVHSSAGMYEAGVKSGFPAYKSAGDPFTGGCFPAIEEEVEDSLHQTATQNINDRMLLDKDSGQADQDAGDPGVDYNAALVAQSITVGNCVGDTEGIEDMQAWEDIPGRVILLDKHYKLLTEIGRICNGMADIKLIWEKNGNQ